MKAYSWRLFLNKYYDPLILWDDITLTNRGWFNDNRLLDTLNAHALEKYFDRKKPK
jgi:hypothetical protein